MPVDTTRWPYSMTKREYVHNDFLIDPGAATSVCQQSLVDSLGARLRGSGAQISNRLPVYDDGQYDDLLAHTRWYRVRRLPDRA